MVNRREKVDILHGLLLVKLEDILSQAVDSLNDRYYLPMVPVDSLDDRYYLPMDPVDNLVDDCNPILMVLA